MARVNYQRDKRLRDLDRQRKQEEKRTRKLNKDLVPAAPGEENPLAPVEGQEEPSEQGEA